MPAWKLYSAGYRLSSVECLVFSCGIMLIFSMQCSHGEVAEWIKARLVPTRPQIPGRDGRGLASAGAEADARLL
ncbi:MAG: hypothetical protein DRP22_01645 [Verrucomicrobia bacterium]|nr:MAG: hypothetical protein DRP22_01645 [Verrucomicrobiota bacterium]